MLEQLKTIVVLFIFLFVAFGVGVLVGIKLPENESYKRWARVNQEMIKKVRPTDVAVMQMPGLPVSDGSSAKAEEPPLESYSDCCPGGVCKLPLPNESSRAAPVKNLDLTFYVELGDKPTESGGSVIRIKKAPLVKKKKVASVVAGSKKQLPKTAGNWELRICSLAQEIKARLVRSKLMKSYPGVEIEAVQVAGKGTWYRVKISNIKDLEKAERYQQEITKAHKYEPLIIKQ
ncbi:MAG: SPOR domain-containing protein [Deltaproteobacteria bacterium]|nr:SPOR domain-containing protein [Deltaproteobacteria bacterium]